MTEHETVDGLPLDKVKAMLERDDLSAEDLERLLSQTTNPGIRSLLWAAIDRHRAKARKEVDRLEEELRTAKQKLARLEAVHKTARPS